MARRLRTARLTWREAWPIWATFIVLFAVAALGLRFFVPAAPRPQVLAQAEDASVPVASLPLNTPVLFAATLPSGDTVEFFIERDSADSIIVAFSSCRRCYRAGHYSQAGQIFCRRCNQQMPKVAPAESPGLEKDCTHIPIPFERSGGNVLVHAQAIAETFAHWYAPVLAQHAKFRISSVQSSGATAPATVACQPSSALQTVTRSAQNGAATERNASVAGRIRRSPASANPPEMPITSGKNTVAREAMTSPSQ